MAQAKIDTNLQRLLRNRLESLHGQWRDNRLAKERIDDEAEQIVADITALQEAVTVVSRLAGQPVEPRADGPNKVLGLGLRDAIEVLEQGNPSITHQEIRRFLESVHFDFKGKKPGNAINMARVALRRKKT